MNVTIGKPCAISEKGFKINNEDLIYPLPEVVTSNHTLFLVCDGVGGKGKGEIASALVCEYFQTFFNTMLGKYEPTNEFIQKAIQYTEAHLDTFVNEHPEKQGMGSTLAMLYIGASGVTLANVGNGCIYQLRSGRIIYKTRNHSSLDSSEITGNIHKHLALPSIQSSTNHARADVVLIEDLQAGDYFFICTDSVKEDISDEELSAIFQKPLPVEIIKDKIVELCYAKAHDSYSFYIVPIQNIQDSANYKQNILSFLYSFI